MSYNEMDSQSLLDLYEDLSAQQIAAMHALRELRKLADQATIDRALSFRQVDNSLKDVESELRSRNLLP